MLTDHLYVFSGEMSSLLLKLPQGICFSRLPSLNMPEFANILSKRGPERSQKLSNSTTVPVPHRSLDFKIPLAFLTVLRYLRPTLNLPAVEASRPLKIALADFKSALSYLNQGPSGPICCLGSFPPLAQLTFGRNVPCCTESVQGTGGSSRTTLASACWKPGAPPSPKCSRHC